MLCFLLTYVRCTKLFSSHHKDLGRLQLRPFQSVIEHIPKLLAKRLLSTRQQHDVIDTLLESSTFSGRNWKFKALEIADAMLVAAPCDLLETCSNTEKSSTSPGSWNSMGRTKSSLRTPRDLSEIELPVLEIALIQGTRLRPPR